MNKFKDLIIVASLLFSTSSFAAAPTLDNIDLSDFEAIIKDFSANSMHNTVSPASSLGKVFGLELGITGGITKAPNFERLSLEQDPASSFDILPHAAILAAASFPGAITTEFTFIPSKDFGDNSIKAFSFGFKWAFSEFLGAKGPVHIAGRFHHSSFTLGFAEVVNNASTGNVPTTTSIELNSKVWGTHILASFKIPVLEPYIGLGFAKATGTISASGTVSIFDTSFSTASSAEEGYSTGHFFAGVNFNLLFFKIGAEVSKAFSTTTYNGKISFYF